LNEEYENLRIELFPKTVAQESNLEDEEKKGLRNQNPVVPNELPLDGLDAYLKQNGLEGKEEWSFGVKGIPPYEIFRAVFKLGERKVEGSGKSKHWAKQSSVCETFFFYFLRRVSADVGRGSSSIERQLHSWESKM